MTSAASRETRAFASEIKFLVPRAVGLSIRDWARRRLHADSHGDGEFGDEYRTTTLYLDSPDLDVLHRRGSFGRSKFRVRRYGDGAQVFLERKLRRPGMLTKRRTLVGLSALSRLLEDTPDAWEGQWFHRRLLLRRLRPVCEVSYHRVARDGTSATGPVRLTLDEDLQASAADRLEFALQPNRVPVLAASMILELKYRSQVPPIFKELVADFSLRPQTASKYRLSMLALAPDTPRDTVDESPQDRQAADGPLCG